MGGIGPEESNGCGLSCETPKSGGKQRFTSWKGVVKCKIVAVVFSHYVRQVYVSKLK